MPSPSPEAATPPPGPVPPPPGLTSTPGASTIQGLDANGEHPSPQHIPLDETHKMLYAVGALFGINVDLFFPVFSIVKMALSRLDATNVAASAFTDHQNYVFGLWEQLAALFLAYPQVQIIALITQYGAQDFARRIETGRDRTRTNILTMLKNKIPQFYPAREIPSVRANRSFDNDVTGSLLCPATYDWENPVHRNGLVNHQREFDVGPANFPRFCWVGEQRDANAPTVGFGAHPLLMKCLIAALYSPSAALDSTDSRVTSRSRQHDGAITRLTSSAIAWACVMLHFCLSTQRTWAAGGEGPRSTGWPYRTFYRNVQSFIEEDMSPATRAALLQAWNDEVLGDRAEDEDAPTAPPVEGSATPLSALDEMRAHQKIVREQEAAAAKEAADAAAAAAAGTGAPASAV